jgi:diguanylate cyclase (GGDEF)-like protein
MDELTGLPTHLDLPRSLMELKGYDPSAGLTAILFDVDGLIWINDRWGHEEGDRVLVRVGRWLEAIAKRKRGKAFRVSGDEFLFLLPETSREHAITLAREVVHECECLRIPELQYLHVA